MVMSAGSIPGISARIMISLSDSERSIEGAHSIMLHGSSRPLHEKGSIGSSKNRSNSRSISRRNRLIVYTAGTSQLDVARRLRFQGMMFMS